MEINEYAAETNVNPIISAPGSESWSTGKKLLVAGASFAAVSALVALLSESEQIPAKATAINPFDVEKYMGTWYEIARMDYKYEKSLSHVTAEYTLKSNGTVRVVNRGYNEVADEWEESTGKAKFASDPEVAQFRVSFFGPFYSGYNVIAIDPRYRYALVAGENLDYLWILSRTTEIPEDVKHYFLDKAKKIGYNVMNLVWTNHDE